MQIIYDTANYQVRHYGVGATYLVLDKLESKFMVLEDRKAQTLVDLLNDDLGDDVTDIGLAAFFILGEQYNNVDKYEEMK